MGGTSLFRPSWPLIQRIQQRYSYVVEQLEILESFVIAEDVSDLANDCLPSKKFSVASKVIGVTSPIWVPIQLAWLLLYSAFQWSGLWL